MFKKEMMEKHNLTDNQYDIVQSITTEGTDIPNNAFSDTFTVIQDKIYIILEDMETHKLRRRKKSNLISNR